MMKKVMVIISFLIVISTAFALTEYPTLKPGESYLIKDRNVTLIGISYDENSILLCINNEKAIVSDSTTVNKVSVSLRSVDNAQARLKLEYKCSNCICSNDCSNKLCIKKESKEITPSEGMGGITTSGIKEVKGIKIKMSTQEDIKKTYNPLPVLISFILIVLALIIFIAEKFV